MKYEAYFTPSPQEATRLLARLLFGGTTEKLSISFMVESPDAPKETVIPRLEEVTIFPIEEICVSDKGFIVKGLRKEAAGVLGQLSIDTTVDPLGAIYIETTAEQN